MASLFTYYKPSLIKLFNIIRIIRANPYESVRECFEVQEILIKRLTFIENKIRVQKSKLKELRRILSTPSEGVTKEKAQIIKDEIEYYKSKIEEYKALLIIFRWVGDALVFTFIERWDVKPLGLMKETSGFISGKKGAKRERKIFREVFEEGNIAILNDLTNCVRYGDLTVVKKGGHFHIFEIKTRAHKNQLKEKQFADLQRILDYIHTDRTNYLFDENQEVKRISIHANPTNHIRLLNRLIQKVISTTKNAYRKVEEGLYYVVLTSYDLDIFLEIEQFSQTKLVIAPVEPGVYAKFAYYPLTLSIYDPNALCMLCEGQMSIFVVIDPNVIKNKLKANGIIVDALFDDDEGGLVVRKEESIPGKPIGLRIGKHLCNRVFTEFLSLDWLLQFIVVSMNKDIIDSIISS